MCTFRLRQHKCIKAGVMQSEEVVRMRNENEENIKIK
jgi:hypothetical protein